MRAAALSVALASATAAPAQRNETAAADECVRHSDCELGQYCDAALACFSCGYISPGTCDAYDSRCCGTTFVAQCPDNPHGCARRGGATGGSVGVDQSLLDYAVEVGVPMLEEQLVSGEMSIPDMDDIDVGFLGTRLDLRDFVVREASFDDTAAQFSQAADGGVRMRTNVGLEVAVGYV
eukprot:COSAG04_NODE_9814_length_830_cov_1.217510_1_plen_178_part_10